MMNIAKLLAAAFVAITLFSNCDRLPDSTDERASTSEPTAETYFEGKRDFGEVFLSRFEGKLELTDEQRTMIAERGREYPLEGLDRATAKQQRMEFRRWLENEVLTEQQIAAIRQSRPE